jgi:hypothetical protein
MTPDEYSVDERDFRALLEEVQSHLPADSLSDVQHWLASAELEMAVESLGLSVAQADVSLSPDAKARLRRLILKYDLDKESVFEPAFWAKVEPYLR